MNADVLDTLIEKTIIPSFSSIGPRLRRRLYHWQDLASYSLEGRVIVLTGGTSGIGQAAADLYAALGATLVLVARDPGKTQQSIARLKAASGNDRLHCVLGDLGKRQEVERIACELAEQFPVIDVLVHNAGALYNERRRAPDGTDLSVELMVATPFLLTGRLLSQLGYRRPHPISPGAQRSSGSASTSEFLPTENDSAARQRPPGRVLTMSSGGMYTQSLSVENLEMPDEDYHGAQQYARAKRAQVVLNELWADRIPASQIVFHALHPGWVATPGIADALPGFSKALGPLGLLRTARDGADTLVWLSADNQAASSSGDFWHDRARRPIDISSRTRSADTPARRQALWEWCEQHTGWNFQDEIPDHVQ
ncbi:MAG: SDR family NAD(P)-dependent oxidoreductase [Granulosicoccus sp.]|nr:SDR family NAD(P)-dependent oxidoreductase [Granulosicoccus sp.]